MGLVLISQNIFNNNISSILVVPVGSVLNRRPVNVCISYIPTETKTFQTRDMFVDNKPDFLRLISMPVENSKSFREKFKKRTLSTSDILEEPSGTKVCNTVYKTIFLFSPARKYYKYLPIFSPEWKTAEERAVYAIDTYPIVMKPKGVKMSPHFGGDSLELLITGKCKLGDHFRQLKAVDDGKSNCVSFHYKISK